MKVAILSESSADEAMTVESIPYKIRHRGVEAIFGQLSAIYRTRTRGSLRLGIIMNYFTTKLVLIASPVFPAASRAMTLTRATLVLGSVEGMVQANCC